MSSYPLDGKHGQTMSGVACNHRLWAAQTVKQRQAWHAIIAFGKHKRSNDAGLGMPSSPLGSTEGPTASGVACHHRLWPAHTVERRRAWHAISTFGQHTRSNEVGRGMPSSPLDKLTQSGVACHYCLWTANTVGRHQAWHAIGSRDSRTASGVASHHLL